MDKKKFLISFEGEDKNLIAGIYEDIELCKRIGYQVYGGEFLPPNIWKRLEEMGRGLGVDIYTQGLNDTSEKRMCMFSPAGEEIYSYDYPAVFFKIEGGNRFKELEHRHFLAAIMGLGIRREKMGDLIVKEGVCYGIISEDLVEFLEDNLTSVGRIEVKVERSSIDEVPVSEFEDTVVLVSSLRLDNIVSAVTGGSRSASADLIDEGLVTVNYSVKRRKDLSVGPGDVISIRRSGKYIFSEVLGESKKGKLRINLKKYV